MEYTLRSSISSSITGCQNEGSASKLCGRASFHSKANKGSAFVSPSKKGGEKPVSMSKSNKVSKQDSLVNKDDAAKANSSKWNYEDEYKYYLENSMKRKLRSSDIPRPQKLGKIHQEKLTLLAQTKTGLSGNFNGALMNGRVVLEKLPTYVFKSDPKSMNSKNNKLRNSTIRRTNEASKNNIKLTSLQLMELQLRSKPIVALDKTVVKKYVAAKRIIQKILKPDE